VQRTLSDDQARYVRSLVRMHIRKMRKTITRFAPKPGQPPDEAAEVLKRFTEKTEFAEETYQALGGDPEQLTPEGDKS
jgi:hypothetical protein